MLKCRTKYLRNVLTCVARDDEESPAEATAFGGLWYSKLI